MHKRLNHLPFDRLSRPTGTAALFRLAAHAELVFSACVVMCAIGLVVPAEPAAAVSDNGTAIEHGSLDGKELLYRKHVDAAHVVWADGKLDLRVVDGQTLRDPDEVAVRLGPDADAKGREVSRIRIPQGPEWSFLGAAGDIVWNGPQTTYENWAPVWAGLGAGHIPDSIDPNSVELHLVDDGGPGDVDIYRVDSTGYPELSLSSKGEDHRSVWTKPGTHGHYNWAFDKPGRYDMQWQVTAMTKDGTDITSSTRVVSWLVGQDSDVGLPEGSYQGTTITTLVEDQGVDDDDDSLGDDGPSDSVDDNPTKWATSPERNICTHIDAGHLDIRPQAGKTRAILRWDDPKSGTAKDIASRKSAIEVPDSSRVAIPEGHGNSSLRVALNSESAFHLPQIQESRMPWPGFSTEDLDVPEGGSVDLTTYQMSGPTRSARMVIGEHDGRSFRVEIDSQRFERQSISMGLRSHVHKAMFFSEPGYYVVSYSFTVKDSAGTIVEDSFFEAWYAVGEHAIGNACERESSGTGLPTEPSEPGDSGNPHETDDPGRPGESGDGSGTTSGAPDQGYDASELGAQGELPRTGSEVKEVGLIAAALIGLGALTVWAARRRSLHSERR